MIITKEELENSLNKLLKSGNTYSCEAQFQFDLAWELRYLLNEKERNDVHIFLEYPSAKKDSKGKRLYYDIVIEKNNSACVIELKYKTKKLNVEFNGHTVELTNQAAQDLGRYDYLKDVSRIENFNSLNDETLKCGYTIFLTNDNAYWDKGGENCIYKDFALNDGRVIPANKKLQWAEGTKKTTVGENRLDAITLKGTYQVKWQPYGPQFKCLIFEIE